MQTVAMPFRDFQLKEIMDPTRQKPRLKISKNGDPSPRQYTEFTCCKQSRKIPRDPWINDVWRNPKVRFSTETTLEMTDYPSAPQSLFYLV